MEKVEIFTNVESIVTENTRYNVQGKAGKNYPIKHGTLYDITIGTKLDAQDDPRQKGPGPGAYLLHQI